MWEQIIVPSQEGREPEISPKKEKYDVGLDGYIGIHLTVQSGNNILHRKHSMSQKVECNGNWQCGNS